MKKVEIRFLKTYNAIIAAALALMGFGYSCITRTEYGVPSAKFIVNGKVESIGSNEAVENIRVTLNSDTALTDASGNYKVEDRYGFPSDQTYNIKFQDIDGVLNGEFNDLDTTVEFKNPVFTNGNGDWYAGETSKEFDVKLDPKK
jgi:putative lipoprotein (rSAM/lipoprotein system)